ncbi:MAG TPA: amino acid ABC transporter permease [Gaiellaceae bacterium]|nr:amino acid ABC transporter permease [Gaiellaceae bacterium]
MATRVDTLEPIPAPEGPPDRRLPPREWARKNLFATRLDTVLTVVFALVAAWLLYRLGKFVFVDARWEIIERNITNLMVSRFPRDELWRVWAALLVLGPALGFGAGSAAAARRREVAEGRAVPPERASALRRAGPALLLVVVLLWFAQSFRATLLTVALGALGVGGYYLGRRLGLEGRKVALVVLAGIVAAFVVITAFGGVGWEDWGGFMLTIFLAVGGILLAFPFGVLLALGRRSSLPAVRVVCVAYIELFRGVPLIAVLFMGAFMIGFLLPEGFETPSLVTRALIALVLFTAAYVAEIVRGGLQGVPAGQVEAAQALGLAPWRITLRIVLPQALRTVIPGLVGQFISLFKDTSLVAIIGLTELLNVSRNITAQPDFLAQGLIVETLVFAAFVYWTGAYWMSRESQRLERRLGLGER